MCLQVPLAYTVYLQLEFGRYAAAAPHSNTFFKVTWGEAGAVELTQAGPCQAANPLNQVPAHYRVERFHEGDLLDQETAPLSQPGR